MSIKQIQLKFKNPMVPMYFVFSIDKDVCECMLKQTYNLYRQKIYGLQGSVMEFKKKKIFVDLLKVVNKAKTFIISYLVGGSYIQKTIDEVNMFLNSVEGLKTSLETVYIFGGKDGLNLTTKGQVKQTKLQLFECACPKIADENKMKEKELNGDSIQLMMYYIYYTNSCCRQNITVSGNKIKVKSSQKIKDPKQSIITKFTKQLDKLQEKDPKAPKNVYYLWQGLKVGFVL